jgi:hypothetical protein
MVSPVRAVVVLVQQLIDEYNLDDPKVIMSISNNILHNVIIPTSITLLMLVSSYQIVYEIYYWVFPLPVKVRYEQAIALYSGKGVGSTNDINKTSSRIVLDNHNNKKTTISDSSTRRFQQIENKRRKQQTQALATFRKLVTKDKYGPALLSLVVHELYVVGNVKEALHFLDLVFVVDDANTSTANKDGDSYGKKKKKKQVYNAYDTSSSKNKICEDYTFVIELSTKTLQRDYMTMKLDAQTLSSSMDVGGAGVDGNHGNNNNNNNIQMTTIMNSKMLKMDYLGIGS